MQAERPGADTSARAAAACRGVAAGVVEKSGAWFSFEGERIGQGRENARQFLKANPAMADTIEAKVRANAGLVADAMLTGPEEDADGEAAAG